MIAVTFFSHFKIVVESVTSAVAVWLTPLAVTVAVTCTVVFSWVSLVPSTVRFPVAELIVTPWGAEAMLQLMDLLWSPLVVCSLHSPVQPVTAAVKGLKTVAAALPWSTITSGVVLAGVVRVIPTGFAWQAICWKETEVVADGPVAVPSFISLAVRLAVVGELMGSFSFSIFRVPPFPLASKVTPSIAGDSSHSTA